MPTENYTVSYGVEVNEASQSRLEQILKTNDSLASSVASSFNSAITAIDNYKQKYSVGLSPVLGKVNGSGNGSISEGGLINDTSLSLNTDKADEVYDKFLEKVTKPIELDLNTDKAEKELNKFVEKASKPIELTANANGIISAANTAIENVQAMFSQPFYINAQADLNVDSSSKNDTKRTTRNDDEEDKTGSAFVKMSTGGRFSSPTNVQVAEDGNEEYIIPVKKESRAIPLLRQLLSELSPEARKSLANVTENKAGSEQVALPVSSFEKADKAIGAEKEKEMEQQNALSAPPIPEKSDKESKLIQPLDVPKTKPSQEIVPVQSVIKNEKELAPIQVIVNSEHKADQELAPAPIVNGSENKKDHEAIPVQSLAKSAEGSDQKPSWMQPLVESLAKPDKESVQDQPLNIVSGLPESDQKPTWVQPIVESLAKPDKESVQNQPLSIASGLPEKEKVAVQPIAAASKVIDSGETVKQENKNDSQLIPAIRQLFKDLLPEALKSLPNISGPKAGSEQLPSTTQPIVQNSSVSDLGGKSVSNTQNNNNVSAPVTINVNASGSNADRIGESIYNTAERYLLRTMKGVFA